MSVKSMKMADAHQTPNVLISSDHSVAYAKVVSKRFFSLLAQTYYKRKT